MKYVKGYAKFVKESKKQIEKNAIIVEKQLLNDFSKGFWNLCVKSSIFTNEEKEFNSRVEYWKTKIDDLLISPFNFINSPFSFF